MKSCDPSTKITQESRLFHDIGLSPSNIQEDTELDHQMLTSAAKLTSVSLRRRNLATDSNDRTDNMDLRNSTCAITKLDTRGNNKNSSNTCPSHTHDKMYTMRRAVRSNTVVDQMFRYRLSARKAPAPTSRYITPSTSLFTCLIVTLTLASCLLISQTRAFESEPSSKASKSSQETTNNKANINERADTPVSTSKSDSATSLLSSPSSSSSSSSSSQNSIVASLSSAVATAAAAAAVAAAQNSLSSNDARSLASASHHSGRHHSQAQRSPGLNLAIKLVDTIPEVPYNILHNMKKLDHAAPFYNVPNKLSGGSTKESGQNFLTNALSASGNFGGAAEQFSSLFKSPLWKRIADGYGDFASEFRSLFRPPGATPMKGPPSSTSKLLRDISVPALLMLLASSISGEWRPIRTRRKSFRPVDIPATSLQNVLQAGSASQSSLNSPSADIKAAIQYQQQQYERPQNFESYSSAQSPLNNFAPAAASSGEWIDQQQQAGAGRQELDHQRKHQQHPLQVGQLAQASSNINLQQLPLMNSQTANWIQPMQSASVLQQLAPVSSGVQSGQHGNFDSQQAVLRRRSDEIIMESDRHLSAGSSMAPAQNNHHQPSRPFGSLASALVSAGHGSNMISKLLNVNVGSDGNAYRMLSSLADAGAGNKMSLIKRDQLSDKQRYSLVGPDETPSSSNVGESSSSAQTKQPLLLSAMAHAVTSMLHHPATSVDATTAKSGSPSSALSPFAAIPGSLQNLIIGDKTINQDLVFMRRQPQATQAEERDLTKLLPESWREVVKRSMTTVQQQANVQWKSIEGQLANWVQNKLKTVSAAASSSPASSSGGSNGGGGLLSPLGGAVPAPIGNMLASMGSTALNILGLNKNNTSSSPSAVAAAATTTSAQVSQAKSQTSGDEQPATANQRGKVDQTKPHSQAAHQQSPSRGALAGVATLIVNTISNRKSPSQSSSPLSNSSPQNKHHNQPNDDKPKSQTLGEILAPMTSVASKYPTHTGAQQSSAPLDKQALSSLSSSSSAAPSPHSLPSVPTTKPAASLETTAKPAAPVPITSS